MKKLAEYTNGNYKVVILDNGTKIRFNNLDNLTPSFAESIDCTITTKCDMNCPWCYMNCNEKGQHADLNLPFFDTLHKGQELALNGNDLSHPDLIPFLERMKAKGVICNLTVNQNHFIKNYDFLTNLLDQKLIHGLGISLTNSETLKAFFFKLCIAPDENNVWHTVSKPHKYRDNMVIHTIDGLLTEEDVINLKGMKVLILGYKVLGRGDQYYLENKDTIQQNIEWLSTHLKEVSTLFKCVSFDNLAIEHLKLKDKLTEEQWNEFYMGDEGQYTFFIDAVNKTYSKSSLETTKFEILDNVDDMFNKIRSKYA